MLKVYVFEVGRGDSLIIETQNGEDKFFSILDCKSIKGRCPTVDFLRRNNITNINCIFLSHLHTDHYSGFPELAEYLKANNGTVKYIVSPISSRAFQIHLEKILEINTDEEEKGLRVRFLSAWTELIKLGGTSFKPHQIHLHFEGDESSNAWKQHLHPGLSIVSLSPTLDQADILLNTKIKSALETNSLVNNLSHVLLVKYDTSNKYILFSGDLEGNAWRYVKNRALKITNNDIQINFILLKAPHHGAYNKGMADSLKELANKNASFCVSISCPSNDINHPDKETLSFFKNNFTNCELACTNLSKHCLSPSPMSVFNSFIETIQMMEFKDALLASKETKFISGGLPCAGHHAFCHDSAGWKVFRSTGKVCTF